MGTLEPRWEVEDLEEDDAPSALAPLSEWRQRTSPEVAGPPSAHHGLVVVVSIPPGMAAALVYLKKKL
jgi:hypothetical protein